MFLLEYITWDVVRLLGYEKTYEAVNGIARTVQAE